MEPLKKRQKISLITVLAGLMVLFSFLLAAGCIGNPPEPAEMNLNGTRWTLQEYVYEATSRHVLEGTTVTLLFSEGGSISGSAGCNHYFGSYELEGDTITIGQVGQTMMYCTGAGVMEQESRYLSLLSDAVSVNATNDTLSFADSHGFTILSFARFVPPAPEPFVGTNWTLNSFYTENAVSSVIGGTTITAVFDNEGRVTGSAGCNHYFGSYILEGDSLSISTVGSTKMNCPGRGIMEQEATYLESFSKAGGFTINGKCMTLVDANGTTLLLFIAES